MNPKKIFPFFWMFVLFLAQNMISFWVPQKTPMLILCGVLFYAYSEGPGFGALLGASAGLLLEVFGTGRIGPEILVFAATGFIFGFGTKTFFRESIFLRFLAPLLAFCFVVFARFFLFCLSPDGFEALPVFRECLTPLEFFSMLVTCITVFFFLKKAGHGLSQS